MIHITCVRLSKLVTLTRHIPYKSMLSSISILSILSANSIAEKYKNLKHYSDTMIFWCSMFRINIKFAHACFQVNKLRKKSKTQKSVSMSQEKQLFKQTGSSQWILNLNATLITFQFVRRNIKNNSINNNKNCQPMPSIEGKCHWNPT